MTNNIQIITNNYYENSDDITVSSFMYYNSLNSFKFNVIDFNNSEIWEYNFITSQYEFLNNLTPLINSIKNSNDKTTFIILLPQNVPVTTKASRLQTDYLINTIKIVTIYLKKIIKQDIELVYGRAGTILEEKEFFADFYLNNTNFETILKNSNGDSIGITIDNFIFTTINITSLDDLKIFINFITPSYKEYEVPEWFGEIKCFNDNDEINNICRYEEEKISIENKIKESEEILEKNNKYKSILYTQGNALVKVVYEILDEMLNTKLSEFNDVFDEDFYFEKDNTGFIGEIKGVKRNLKNEYLNQLNDHAVKKLLTHDEKEIDLPLKQIMIINTFRKRHPDNRPDIENETVDKAKLHGALVITTPELLKLYELFKKGEIESDNIIEDLKNDVGIFQIK